MFFRNRDRKTFAIGDIHGCARELSALLEKIKPSPEDTVVFLGDYIDRGPDSKKVIDIILDLSRRTHVVALMGNHEAMLLDFLERPDTQGAGMFVLNGGSSTLASYTEPGASYSIPEEHLEFFKGLKYYYETDTHFFVHAGVPVQSLKEIDFASADTKMQLIWTRQPFLSSTFQWEKIIVHGHTPSARVESLANRINLDTGCVYGNALTALELPRNIFHYVVRGVKKDITIQRDIHRIQRRFSGHLPVRAGKPNGKQHPYETLNYNQFGLLMRELDSNGGGRFQPGDAIEGEIGVPSEKDGAVVGEVVKFVGAVVRTDARGEYVLYAVRIDRISGGAWGPDWVERPAS